MLTEKTFGIDEFASLEKEGEFSFGLKSIAPYEEKADDEPGTFTGYLSTFGNVDHQGDFVRKGAFKRSLRRIGKKGLPLLWQHDQRDPIGRLLLSEDEKGLRVDRGRINLDTTRGRDAHALLKAGDVNLMSIGYATVKDRYDAEKEARELIEVNLWEGSIVTIAANDRATINQVKSRLVDDLTAVMFSGRGEPPEQKEIEKLVDGLLSYLEGLEEKNSAQIVENAFDWLFNKDVRPDEDDSEMAGAISDAFNWTKKE